MNRLLDRIAELYAPLGQRGLLMDGHYRFAPDRVPAKGRKARTKTGHGLKGLARKPAHT
ncbi:hypothetical protein KPL74_17130 [Bacillus sp. NP157]|nr:hypothetical protein KPL74_17130 [Bacillus sp. NP157]